MCAWDEWANVTLGEGWRLPSLSGAMHSNVTRNLYGSRKRAGLFRNSTFWWVVSVFFFFFSSFAGGRTRIVTMDMVVLCLCCEGDREGYGIT